MRSVYSGLLTYAANATHAADEFSHIQFWDDLDYIGLDGYFPVHKGWREHIDAIHRIAAKFNKPLIFTEVGYRSARNAAKEPWNHQSAGKPDPAHQAQCYADFFEAWSAHEAWMHGAFWWSWAVPPPLPEDTGYNPRGKPAEAVLKKWFRSERSARVEELRRQVQSGQYHVDAAELSKAIIRHHLHPREPKR